MRILIAATLVSLAATFSLADDSPKNDYIMNFDITSKTADGADYFSIQLQGVGLSTDKGFHGVDLGEFDYFFTISSVVENEAKLTIEFYEYDTHRKKSKVVSEIVSEIDFVLGSPTNWEAKNERFGIDLAFSVVRK